MKNNDTAGDVALASPPPIEAAGYFVSVYRNDGSPRHPRLS